MDQLTRLIRRIAHWIGVLLAFPFVAALAIGLLSWSRGEFPPTVDIWTVFAVGGLLAAAAVIVYLFCVGVGWIVIRLVASS